MRWALIELGRVARLVEQEQRPTNGLWILAGGADIGWRFDAGLLVPGLSAAAKAQS